MLIPRWCGATVLALALTTACQAGSGEGEGETEGEAETNTTDTGSAAFEVGVEVVLHPGQSMVADLVFDHPELEVEVVHSDDPGVLSAPLDADTGTGLRLRGLAPGTTHSLSWTATNAAGETDSGELELTTNDPQPGFVPSFAVEGAGLDGYVIMDLMTREPSHAGLFVVDADGVTRWHLGRNAPVFEPDSVFGAAHLGADGSMSYVRAKSLYVIDEVGNEILRLDSPTIGVPGLHHELVPLENGNYLSMSYTFADVDYGDPEPVHVTGDLLVEVSPAGEVVWQWNSFDHLDPLRTLPGFDQTITNPATGQDGQDWTHGNGLVYEPDTDSVLFSMRHQDWVIRIDRQTGEVLWRLGPDGDFALSEGEWFYHQHSPSWQPDGTLMIYDNGLANPELELGDQHSRVVRYALDEDTMTATQVWEDGSDSFMVPIGGDAERLDDGSLLITDGSRDMFLNLMHGQIRKIDEDAPASPSWVLTTEPQSFIYRSSFTTRLPGQSE